MAIALRLAAPFSDKARRAVEGRKNWDRRLEDALHNAPPGKRVLLHAPSVGEFFQGRAVLDELLKKHPDLVVIVTHFSPSAENIVAGYEPAAACSLLPFDNLRNVKRFLDIVKPDMMIYARADVWPNLAKEAKNRCIPSALVAGTLSSDAGRLNPIAAKFAVEGLRTLDLIAAISEDDANRFIAMGVDHSCVEAAGDPRFDQTWKRAKAVKETDLLFSGMPLRSPTLVAGSTWPSDEDVVLPAFAAVKRAIPQARLVIAPHETTKTHIANIKKIMKQLGLSYATLSEVENNDAEDPEVIVIDRVGVLAKLYHLGSVAFVGGSFVRRVHNTMEPACMGIPVLIGPKHANAREAQLLIKSGGGFCVKNTREMESKLIELFQNKESALNAGRAAIEFVESNLGAAARTAELIERRFSGLLE